MFFRQRRQGVHPPSIPETTGRMSNAELLDAIYVGVLSRPATDYELEQGRLALENGQPLSGLVRSILDQKVFFELMNGAQPGRVSGKDNLINDVSQDGEVGILIKHMINDVSSHRTVVDVGARGVIGSNSYDLLRFFRWRGLLVEANTRLIDQIRKDFAGLDCEIEACAVSDFEGEANFCIGVNDDVSSLDETLAASWGPVADRLSVRVRRLSSLLDQHCLPLDFDLLCLDIEHHDVRVLNDLVANSAYRPKWIIIEAPTGAFLNNLETAGCSVAVRDAYTIVDVTFANFILRRTVDRPV